MLEPFSHLDQIGELVRRGAMRSPDRIAVKTALSARTYAELDQRSTRLANAMLGQGLTPGDRVAAWMDDCVEYLEIYVAAAKAGLVVVPVNARLTVSEARHPIVESQPGLLFVTPRLFEAAGEFVASGAVRKIIHATPNDQRGAFERLVQDGSSSLPPLPSEDALYIIGYTSGTTGVPKGAALTHRTVKSTARSNALAYRLALGSIGVFAGSMSFVALVPAFIFSHLYVGGTIVMTGPVDVEAHIDTIARERATYSSVASPRIREFAAAAAAAPGKLESLASLVHGGSKVPRDHLQQLLDVVGDRLIEGWGLTENSGGMVSVTSAVDMRGGEPTRDVLSTVGRPVPDVVVDALDEAGEPVPHDGATLGNLTFSSPSLMTGYWKRPEETAAVLRNGWYSSGDLGAIDPAGYIYFADRRTDLVVSGGMNVYPSEVEACLTEHPAVDSVAVFGIPHERWGQGVAAAVVRRDGYNVTEADLIAHCRKTLASFKKPTRIWFVPELPHTASGKVQRGAIRDELVRRLTEQDLGSP